VLVCYIFRVLSADTHAATCDGKYTSAIINSEKHRALIRTL
jgi:hypothetical protein